MKRMFLLAALLSSATLLVSCGGGGSGGAEESMMVAAEDLEVRIDATNGPQLFKALEDESFVYDEGVTDFETTTPTTVDILPGGPGEGLQFRIASDGHTATGDLDFGSCLFRIKSSSYPTKLTRGSIPRVRDCVVRVNVARLPADGSLFRGKITLKLKQKTATRNVMMRINKNGAIVIKSVVFGTVKVRPITGTGGF